MKTKQEIFDIVVTHLRKQGVQSVDPGTTLCRYRAKGGLKCAAGALIPDELYSPDMEAKTVAHYVIRDALIRAGMIAPEDDMSARDSNLWLIRNLQAVHDSYSPFCWEAEFRRLAAKHNLTYTPPT